MKSRPFFKGLSWLLILNVLVKPVWILLIDRQVQLIAGHEAYGQYFSLLSLSYLLIFLADAGLTNTMNQQLAAGKSLHLPQLLRVKLLLSLLYLLAALLLAWFTGVEQWTLLVYILAIQWLNSFFVFTRNVLTGQQRFTADALLSVLDKAIMIIACGSLIYAPRIFGGIDLERFLQVQTGATAIALIIAAILASNKGVNLAQERLPMASIFRTIAPFAFIILLMSLHYKIDGFLIERLHPEGALEAGKYAAAYRLLDISNMVGYLAASFLVPFIARHQQDTSLIGATLVRVRHLLLLFAFAAVLFAFFYSGWIAELLYHTTDDYISTLIFLSLAALPGYMLVHIYGSWLTATERFSSFIYILIVAVLINVVFNMILIPAEGAKGAATAAILSQLTCGALCWFIANRKGASAGSKKEWWFYPSALILFSLLFYLGQRLMLNVWLILALAAAMALALLLRSFPLFKELLNNR